MSYRQKQPSLGSVAAPYPSQVDEVKSHTGSREQGLSSQHASVGLAPILLEASVLRSILAVTGNEKFWVSLGPVPSCIPRGLRDLRSLGSNRHLAGQGPNRRTERRCLATEGPLVFMPWVRLHHWMVKARL